jgi:hypothetical protein
MTEMLNASSTIDVTKSAFGMSACFPLLLISDILFLSARSGFYRGAPGAMPGAPTVITIA